MINKLKIENLSAIFFDFDGVLTSNKVFVNQDGIEMVCCNRSDGLAFDLLKKFDVPVFIVSSEANPVVTSRSRKLGVEAIQGVKKKHELLDEICKEKKINITRALFVGNDLNDYYAMKSCGYSICPSDSHNIIKDISDYVLKSSGGEGVVRELVEDVFNLDLIKLLYNK